MTELPADVDDVDDVLHERAAQAEAASNVVPLESSRRTVAELHDLLERATEAASQAEERAVAAETEAEELRRRVRELESWLAGVARSEQIEQVQLGRLLALASAEREERRQPPISARALLLALYVFVAVAFVVLVATGRL
jgi:seryl-tRNA synthetase